MNVLALPRDPNPYQEQLYAAMSREGVRVRYLAEGTRSQTLNLLLLPVELVLWRVRGFRVLHVHWVYLFAPPWVADHPSARRLMRWWFGAFLGAATVLGLRVVWIVHNVLPHEQVFDDDVAGRRRLLRAAHAVVVHDAAVVDQLNAMGPVRHAHVARLPVYDVPAASSGERRPGPLRVLFFGLVLGYKGVEDLLAAAGSLRSPARIKVVGECRSPELRAHLGKQAVAAGSAVSMDLRRVSDAELSDELEDADVVVLPFRRVTTSSSVLLAMSAARPVLVPAHPSLASFPSDAVLRYPLDGDRVGALSEAIEALAASPSSLRPRGRAARRWAVGYTWDDLARDVSRASAGVTAGSR